MRQRSIVDEEIKSSFNLFLIKNRFIADTALFTFSCIGQVFLLTSLNDAATTFFGIYSLKVDNLNGNSGFLIKNKLKISPPANCLTYFSSLRPY